MEKIKRLTFLCRLQIWPRSPERPTQICDNLPGLAGLSTGFHKAPPSSWRHCPAGVGCTRSGLRPAPPPPPSTFPLLFLKGAVSYLHPLPVVFLHAVERAPPPTPLIQIPRHLDAAHSTVKSQRNGHLLHEALLDVPLCVPTRPSTYLDHKLVTLLKSKFPNLEMQ